jgi:hypothetical protein
MLALVPGDVEAVFEAGVVDVAIAQVAADYVGVERGQIA